MLFDFLCRENFDEGCRLWLRRGFARLTGCVRRRSGKKEKEERKKRKLS